MLGSTALRMLCARDRALPDCPIIHASPQFLRLTEYSRYGLLGVRTAALWLCDVLMSVPIDAGCCVTSQCF
jgi:hypothetical protein